MEFNIGSFCKINIGGKINLDIGWKKFWNISGNKNICMLFNIPCFRNPIPIVQPTEAHYRNDLRHAIGVVLPLQVGRRSERRRRERSLYTETTSDLFCKINIGGKINLDIGWKKF
jgi:hypothetical protein